MTDEEWAIIQGMTAKEYSEYMKKINEKNK